MHAIFVQIPVLFVLCFHHFPSPMVRGAESPPLFNRTESLALSCGSPDNSTAQDGRVWTGEAAAQSSGLLSLRHPDAAADSSSAEAADRPFTFDKVPYSTARISRVPFSYIFPVTPGQKFLRLHFYPTSYAGGFDRSAAFFSITANRHTLLHNFSASLAVDHLGREKFVYREFCINVAEGDDPTINVTFAPTSTVYYAFVNGIEVVSMPTGLYYSGAGTENSLILLGPQMEYRVENHTALEMMYRLNVGEWQPIEPIHDTGMYRSWSQDAEYLPKRGVAPINGTFHIKFTSSTPPYVAPEEVYRSARSMGWNKSVNVGYNLTWELPVDVQFVYFLRLHFCEFKVNITQETDREFHIYIADQTAEERADVIAWSGGNGVPVYRDYAVLMDKIGGENRRNLSIALHPNGDSRTRYSDAILNGIEVFKVSDSSGSLAAPNPEPTPSLVPPLQLRPSKEHKNNHKGLIISISVVVSLAVAAAAAMAILRVFVPRYAKQKESNSGKGSSPRGPTIPPPTPLPSERCLQFSLSEILAATNNFDDLLIIGRGGFGDVYKGYIQGRSTAVAIKRLKPGSKQGAHEFKMEIKTLSQLRHLNLVSLIGYCNDSSEMILVYEYMSRGTLRDHLYGGTADEPPLSWEQRLRICVGAARGLQYIHAGANHTIIHRDVKTTNILLDENWAAKVSDFGLSKVDPRNVPNAHISTQVKGSHGYFDPEYFRRNQLTQKSDVYSFGVVLLEVLCARLPLNRSLPKDQVSLAEWGRICSKNGMLDQVVDPALKGRVSGACLKVYEELAMRCLGEEGIGRPSMDDVVGCLEFALQLQESEDASMEYPEDGEISSSDGMVAEWLMTTSSGGGESSTAVITEGESESSSLRV